MEQQTQQPEQRGINALIATSIDNYPTTKTKLEALVAEYKDLKIDGLEDKFGAAQVSNARKHAKAIRCDIDAYRKAENADALKFQRAVNAKAKELTRIIQPVEDAMELEEARIQKIKYEAEAAEIVRLAKRNQERMDALTEVGAAFPFAVVSELDKEAFDALLEEATELHADKMRRAKEEEERAIEVENNRLAALEKERKALNAARIERERLLAESQRIADAERKQLEADRAALTAERQEIQDAKDKIAREERAIAEAKEPADATQQPMEAIAQDPIPETEKPTNAPDSPPQERAPEQVAPQATKPMNMGEADVRNRHNVALYMQAVAELNIPPGIYFVQVSGLREAFLSQLSAIIEQEGGA